MRFHLGIIRDEHGHIRNHRGLLQVILNPVLRLFGWCIATKFNGEQPRGLTVVRSELGIQRFLRYSLPDGWSVEKRRRFF